MAIDPGYPTAVHDACAGPAVVLVHGTPLHAGAWEGLAGELAPSRLAALPVPAHFVAAEHDLVATPDDLRTAAAVPPDAGSRLEPGLGHRFPVGQPERLARLPW